MLLKGERILAHEEEARHFPADRHPARPYTGNAFVRVDLDDVNAGSCRRRRLPRRVERLRHRVLEKADFNCGDLHSGSSFNGCLSRDTLTD